MRRVAGGPIIVGEGKPCIPMPMTFSIYLYSRVRSNSLTYHHSSPRREKERSNHTTLCYPISPLRCAYPNHIINLPPTVHISNHANTNNNNMRCQAQKERSRTRQMPLQHHMPLPAQNAEKTHLVQDAKTAFKAEQADLQSKGTSSRRRIGYGY